MRRAAWGGGVLLGTLAAGVFLSRRTLDSYDATIMFTVAKSIATTHTTFVPAQVDPFRLSSPHSSFGLGMSLLELPGYLVATATGHDPQAAAMLVNPALFALVAVAIWVWALVAGASPARAAAVALLTSFTTPLLAYVPTGGSELGTALGVAVGLIGVQLTRSRLRLGAAVAGAGAGVAVLMRPDSVLLVAIPLGLAVVLQARERLVTAVGAGMVYALALVPAGVVTLVYSGAHGAQYQGFSLAQGFSHPLLAGLYGLVLSPGRGLLLYAPIVVLAGVALPWAWARSPVVTALCVVLVLDRLFFYAGWYAWQGGWAWGPRFVVPAMPALAPMLLEVVRRVSARSWRSLAWAAALLVALLSLSVQALGASVRYDMDRANLAMTAAAGYSGSLAEFRTISTSQPAEAAEDRVLFDWRYFPIADHASRLLAGRDLAGRGPRWLARQGAGRGPAPG